MNTYQEIAIKLYEAREKSKITEKEVEEKTGIKKENLKDYEVCKKIPSVKTLAKLIKLYKVDINWILGIKEEKNIEKIIKEKIMKEQIKESIKKEHEYRIIRKKYIIRVIPNKRKNEDENIIKKIYGKNYCEMSENEKEEIKQKFIFGKNLINREKAPD